MYNTHLVDNSPREMVPISEIAKGCTFLLGDNLFLKIESDLVKYDDMDYGVIIQSSDLGKIGELWMFSNVSAKPVDVEATFTIVS